MHMEKDSILFGDYIVGDLFQRLDLKTRKEDFNKRLDTSLVRTEEFDLPLVNAKDGNNGIMYYGRKEDFDNEELCIDIVQNGAVATGNVYVQEECTGVLWDAYLIKPFAQVGKYALLYVATVLRKVLKRKFSYENKAIWDKVKEVVVALPQTSDGQPDWAYMERYMQAMERKTKEHIENILAPTETKPLNITNFKKFHLYDDGLFIIDNGTKLDKVRMKTLNPSVNFVGRSNANNGVTDFIDRLDDIEPYPAGYMTLSLGGEYLGSCFVQKEPFYTSQNVVVLIPQQEMSWYAKQYIATMVFREGRLHYKAFLDELNRHVKRDFTILLPITKVNQPDWAYMERYMQEIEKETNTRLASLSII